jgi:hypothetical protein
MLHFEMKTSDRFALRDYSREFQAAVGELASQKLGVDWNNEGIAKYEGGVCVNKREIAIHDGFVVDDWARNREASPEETAVVEAIIETIDRFHKEGEKVFEPYRNVTIFGDPLRALIL